MNKRLLALVALGLSIPSIAFAADLAGAISLPCFSDCLFGP